VRRSEHVDSACPSHRNGSVRRGWLSVVRARLWSRLHRTQPGPFLDRSLLSQVRPGGSIRTGAGYPRDPVPRPIVPDPLEPNGSDIPPGLALPSSDRILDERGLERIHKWEQTTKSTAPLTNGTMATACTIARATPAIKRDEGRKGTVRRMWKTVKRVQRNLMRPAEPMGVVEKTASFEHGQNPNRGSKPEKVDSDGEGAKKETSNVAGQLKNMRMLAAVAPFAAVSTTNATFPLIVQALASFLKIYLLLLFLRVLLTWFPNFDWMVQPWVTLRQVTDPYLNLFRGFVPPLMGQIDFTPVVGFLLLQWLHETLESSTESLW